MGCAASPDAKPVYSENVKPISSSSAKIRIAPKPPAPHIDHLERIDFIGKGSFSSVSLVWENDTGRKYALKILSKHEMIKKQQVDHVNNMRSICERRDMAHPFIVQQLMSFQTSKSLRVVMELCTEVLSTLRGKKYFSEPITRYYMAQATCALGHLHGIRVLHRNIKPEAILLDDNCRLKLAAFCFCKHIELDKSTYTLVGCPEYLAPEVIVNTGHGYQVDWWQIGILTYEFLVGRPLFWEEDITAMYSRILKGNIAAFPDFMDPSTRCFIKGLCNVDRYARIGSKGDADEVAQQQFFRGLCWDTLLQGEVPKGCEALKKADLLPFHPDKIKEVADDAHFQPYHDRMDPFTHWGAFADPERCGDHLCTHPDILVPERQEETSGKPQKEDILTVDGVDFSTENVQEEETSISKNLNRLSQAAPAQELVERSQAAIRRSQDAQLGKRMSMKDEQLKVFQ